MPDTPTSLMPATPSSSSLAERAARIRKERFSTVDDNAEAVASTPRLRAWAEARERRVDLWSFRGACATGTLAFPSTFAIIAVQEGLPGVAAWVGAAMMSFLVALGVGAMGAMSVLVAELVIGARTRPEPIRYVNAATDEAHELVLSSATTLRALNPPTQLQAAVDCMASEADELLVALAGRDAGPTDPGLYAEHRRLVDLACQAAAAVEAFREHRLAVEDAVHQELEQRGGDYGLADAIDTLPEATSAAVTALTPAPR